jgi:hypothetical protein
MALYYNIISELVQQAIQNRTVVLLQALKSYTQGAPERV